MSYTIRDGKKGKSIQIRISKRGTKGYDSKTVRIPDEVTTQRGIRKFAEEEERKFENECKNGCKNSNITFKQFVEEDYFVNNERKDDHKSMLARTIPQLGHRTMNEISRVTIQNFVDILLRDKNTKSGKPISVKTVRNNISFVSDVFAYAIRTGMNVENPCRDIVYPKSHKKEASYYSDEEIKVLLTAIEKYKPATKYKLFVYIAITTGMRKGEILGLEWKNIDLETGDIKIVQSAKYCKDKGMYIGVPKTEKSVRNVRVPEEVVAILKSYKAEQENYKYNMGTKWRSSDDFLFTQEDGTLMSIQTPYEWLKNFCEEHDLPFKAIHSMRHSVASMMIANKMDVVSVSSILGHAQVATTLNIYSHQFSNAKEEACTVITQQLFGKK